MKGIDVSKHQKVIDWKQVKSAGIKFAMIRAGYGVNSMDECFQANIKGALENGIKVGVYWFIYARNEAEAIKNAQMFDAVIKGFKNQITLKTWCDYEYDTDRYSRDSGIAPTKESRTKIVRAFCDKMSALGYEVGVYANPDYLRNYFGDLKKYPLWLAHYTTESDKYCDCEIWQYTSKGKVAGISGNVDMNIFYGEIVVPKVEPEYYDTPEFTLIDSLNKIGVDSSFKHRAKIAEANHIQNYQGSVEQNLIMLQLLNEGKLIVA